MDLACLKKQIARIEGRAPEFADREAGRVCVGEREPVWRLGVDGLDANLPEGRLAGGALHDFTPHRVPDVPAVSGFVLRLLQRLPRHGPILWCQSAFSAREYGRFDGPGLSRFDLAADRIVFVSPDHHRHTGFVLEEAVRTGKLAAVVGEGPPLGFSELRRLSLASGQSGVPCLFLNTRADPGPSAAFTRWRVEPVCGPPDPADPKAPGAFAWSLALTRARGGTPGSWEVAWNDQTHSFRSLSEIGNGSFPARAKPEDAVHAGSGTLRRRRAG